MPSYEFQAKVTKESRSVFLKQGQVILIYKHLGLNWTEYHIYIQIGELCAKFLISFIPYGKGGVMIEEDIDWEQRRTCLQR